LGKEISLTRDLQVVSLGNHERNKGGRISGINGSTLKAEHYNAGDKKGYKSHGTAEGTPSSCPNGKIEIPG